ncbi:MAG: YecA family protein [Promethearchaeota archaeon]
MGNKILMNRKPVIMCNKSAISNDGKKGIVVEESDEEIALHRWREGNFTDEEKEISSRWREKTTKPNKLKDMQDHFKNSIPSMDIKFNLETLKEKLDETILIKQLQTYYLKSLISLLHLDSQTTHKIFLRWEQNNFQTLKDFSPYAFFCLNIQVFFLQALGLELVGSKSTNDIDLMYLFYLPFCNVFSSGDNFHKKIVPSFLSKDQSFISAEDLRSDLQKLSIEEKRNKSRRKHTPQNPDSFTYKYWKQYIDWFPDELEMIIHLENEESKRIQKIMKELKENKISEVNDILKDSEIEFIQKKIKVNLDDLCPCGSGKVFRDCCLARTNDD